MDIPKLWVDQNDPQKTLIFDIFFLSISKI